MAMHELAERGNGRAGANVEVNGRAIQQIVEGMPNHAEHKARAFLAEGGIENPRPGEWYPRRAWVETLELVGARIGEATLRQIGTAVVDDIRWPDAAECFEDGIDAVDRAYRVNLRGDVDGGYREIHADDDRVVVRCETPHPPAFDDAVLTATARAFPDDGIAEVTDVSDEYNGSPGSVFDVSWWSLGE